MVRPKEACGCVVGLVGFAYLVATVCYGFAQLALLVFGL
jgi:hypothetical protein